MQIEATELGALQEVRAQDQSDVSGDDEIRVGLLKNPLTLLAAQTVTLQHLQAE